MSGADDLRKFAQDLGRVEAKSLPEVDKVLKKGSQVIKEDLAADAKGSKHFKGMAGSISYDSQYGFGSVGYVIGPDKARRGGALGNVAYFGTSRGGGTLDLEGPLDREAPNVERELGSLVDRLGDELE